MLNQSIKTIIESLTPTTLYMRAASPAEANLKAQRTKIGSNPIAIVTGQFSTDYSVTNTVTNKVTTIEIFFLYLNDSQDEDAVNLDALIDNAQAIAEQFVQLMVANTPSNPTVSVDDYKFDPEPGIRLTNEILTGGLLTLDWPEVVDTYYCG